MKFIVLRHAGERWKSTNTGRLAAMAVENCKILDYATEPESPSPLRGEFSDAWLLFPGSGSQFLSTPPTRIVVIDATWSQARKMIQRIPALRGLPRLSLPIPAVPAIRLRRGHFPEAMSTCEAIARAIALFEGQDRTEPLVQFHALWARRVLASRGLA